MNLGFKTHFNNGEPTYFVEKICSNLLAKDIISFKDLDKGFVNRLLNHTYASKKILRVK